MSDHGEALANTEKARMDFSLRRTIHVPLLFNVRESGQQEGDLRAEFAWSMCCRHVRSAASVPKDVQGNRCWR